MMGLRYSGQTLQGIPSGKGKMFYEDASQYNGHWVNGLREGFGVQTFAIADVQERVKYEGEWFQDNMTGQGTMTWNDTSGYVGHWLNNKRQGKGIFYFAPSEPQQKHSLGSFNQEDTMLQMEGIWAEDNVFTIEFLLMKNGDIYVRNSDQLKHFLLNILIYTDINGNSRKALNVNVDLVSQTKDILIRNGKIFFFSTAFENCMSKSSNKLKWYQYQRTLKEHLNCSGQVTSFLYQNKNGFQLIDTVLHFASQNGIVEIVKLILEKKEGDQEKNTMGKTSLHLASENGHLEVVKYLLEKGESVETKDNDGWTPLYGASQNDHLEVVKYLLEEGASVDTKQKYGQTPLYIASHNGHLEVVKYLLEKGAHVETTEIDGQTPLYISSQNGHLEVVKYLLKKGASVDTKQKDGQTPLYTSSQNGHIEVVKYLLEKGASVDTKQNDGRTPVYISLQNGHLEVVKYLLEKGYKCGHKTNR